MRFMTHGTVPTISFFPELLQVVMAKYGMMSTHRKTYEKCEACNKNSAGYTSAIQRELQKKKDSISRYSMESEKNKYRLKKGNTYLLVIFTPDSFRFREKNNKRKQLL